MSENEAAMDQLVTKLVHELTATMHRWGDEAEAAGMNPDDLGPLNMAGLIEMAGRFIAYVVAPTSYEDVKVKFAERLDEAIARHAPDAAAALRTQQTIEGMKARLAARIRSTRDGGTE